VDEVARLLARLPVGWSETTYAGRRWGVTRTVHGDGRSQSVLAEELGGSRLVSTNAYLLGGELVLKPCEMPVEVVLAFLAGHDPGA
jgi:hypothetical protein